MDNKLIHVVLPQSFVDKMNGNVLDVADAMSLAYNGKNVSFQIDILPDNFFDSSIVWLTSK